MLLCAAIIDIRIERKKLLKIKKYRSYNVANELIRFPFIENIVICICTFNNFKYIPCFKTKWDLNADN